jgi:hypothetical protein
MTVSGKIIETISVAGQRHLLTIIIYKYNIGFMQLTQNEMILQTNLCSI